MINTKNRGVAPLVIVLALAAVLAIIFKLYNDRGKQEAGSNNEPANLSQEQQGGQNETTTQGTSSKGSTSATPSAPKQTAGLKTYTNATYNFEIKYPSSWPAPREFDNRTIGPKFEKKISFRNSFSGADAVGFDVKIYKTRLNFTRVETQTDDLLPQTSLTPGAAYDSTCGVFATAALDEVYKVSGDKCFKEAYFFTVFKNNLIYNIVPMPKGGIGYAGYDGKARAQEIPGLNAALDSFRFTK